jgi:hypothetical protein
MHDPAAQFLLLPLYFRVIEMHALEDGAHTIVVAETRRPVPLEPVRGNSAVALQGRPQQDQPPALINLRVTPEQFAQCWIGKELDLVPAAGVTAGMDPQEKLRATAEKSVHQFLAGVPPLSVARRAAMSRFLVDAAQQHQEATLEEAYRATATAPDAFVGGQLAR